MDFTASGWLKETELGPVLTATEWGYSANSSVAHCARLLSFSAFASRTLDMRVILGPGILLSGEKNSRYVKRTA